MVKKIGHGKLISIIIEAMKIDINPIERLDVISHPFQHIISFGWNHKFYILDQISNFQLDLE